MSINSSRNCRFNEVNYHQIGFLGICESFAYQPWSTSNNDNDYWAYGYWQNNLNSQNGQADWGYNVITNGGNTENSGWRMLSQCGLSTCCGLPVWDFG